MQHRRTTLIGHMLITPADQSQHDRVQIPTLGRQPIFFPQRTLLIGDLCQHAMLDQLLQPACEQVPSNTQAPLKLVKTANPEETIAQYQQRPLIADHRQGARQRTGLLIQFFPAHAGILID